MISSPFHIARATLQEPPDQNLLLRLLAGDVDSFDVLVVVVDEMDCDVRGLRWVHATLMYGAPGNISAPSVEATWRRGDARNRGLFDVTGGNVLGHPRAYAAQDVLSGRGFARVRALHGRFPTDLDFGFRHVVLRDGSAGAAVTRERNETS